MKTILFAAALSVSGAALAQAASDTQPVDEEATVEESTTTATTAPPMETPGTADTPTPVAPGNADPERDARGIPVISAAAVAPAGANEPFSVPPGATVVPSSNAGAVFATEAGSEDYPPCTRDVTDNCVQTYERGVGPD